MIQGDPGAEGNALTSAKIVRALVDRIEGLPESYRIYQCGHGQDGGLPRENSSSTGGSETAPQSCAKHFLLVQVLPGSQARTGRCRIRFQTSLYSGTLSAQGLALRRS